MDKVISFLHDILPFFHVTAILVILFKLTVVIANKGLNPAALLISFFRIYTKEDRKSTENERRLLFMKWNNILNWYLYIWLILFFFIKIIFLNVHK